jgi:hypothetical protein
MQIHDQIAADLVTLSGSKYNPKKEISVIFVQCSVFYCNFSGKGD